MRVDDGQEIARLPIIVFWEIMKINLIDKKKRAVLMRKC